MQEPIKLKGMSNNHSENTPNERHGRAVSLYAKYEIIVHGTAEGFLEANKTIKAIKDYIRVALELNDIDVRVTVKDSTVDYGA